MTDKTGIYQFCGNDFSDWAFRINALFDELQISIVLKEEPSDEDLRDAEFILADAKAKNLIIKHVAPSHIQYIRGKTTAKAMWEALSEIFQRKSRTKRVYLKRQLNDLKCNDSESLQSYFYKSDESIREYKDAGGSIEDDETVVQLLSS